MDDDLVVVQLNSGPLDGECIIVNCLAEKLALPDIDRELSAEEADFNMSMHNTPLPADCDYLLYMRTNKISRVQLNHFSRNAVVYEYDNTYKGDDGPD